MRSIHRIRRVVHVAAIALALGLVCGPGRESRADNESDRQRYLSEINAKLGAAASELSGFESDSDAGDLDDARGYVREVESLVDKLDDVKDDDSTARDVASRYPRTIEDWTTAAGYLRQLKQQQPLAAGYLKSCKAWDEAMRDRAKASKDDPRAADDLSGFAKSVGRQGQELVSEGTRVRDQLGDAAEEVADFSPDDSRWSRLRDATRFAADQIWRRWDKDFAEATKACEEVVKGERHRDIEEALGRLGNSKAGRAELRTKLTAMLAVIASRMNDVASQSSESNVAGAIEVTREVGSLLERLKAAQGDDDEAKQIAATWPTWNDELRASLDGVLAMKQNQHRADDGEAKCLEAKGALQELIKTVIGNPDRQATGVEDLGREARRLGEVWLPKLAAAAEGDRQVADGYKAAKRFARSDGPWREIHDHLHASADAIRKHWAERYAAAVKECHPLSLGEQHPAVVKAVAEVGQDLSASRDKTKELYVEVRRWKALIDQLRDWSNQDAEEIRAGFCAAPDAGQYAEADAVADRWAAQLKQQFGQIEGMAEQLKHSADALVAKGRNKDRMDKLKVRIDATIASLANVKAHQLLGSNNPLFKAQGDYGRKVHDDMQKGCDAREITIDDDYCDNPKEDRDDCRLDCMKGCVVIEIKPKSQVRLGNDQVRAYHQGLLKMFSVLGPKMFEERGMAYFRKCLSSDQKTLSLTFAVEPYDFCEGMTAASTLTAPVPAVEIDTGDGP